MLDFWFKMNYVVQKLDFNRLIVVVVVVSSFVVHSCLVLIFFSVIHAFLRPYYFPHLDFLDSVRLFTTISMWFSFRRSNCNVIHQNGRNHDYLFKSIIIHYSLFFKLGNRFIGLQYHRNHHHLRQQQQQQQQ